MSFESTRAELIQKIQNIQNNDFEALACAVFQYQYEYNALYREFVDLLKINRHKVTTLAQIPFLPIHLFKSHIIKTADLPHEVIFTSSGTTDSINAQHYVTNGDFYRKITEIGFRHFYGNIEDYCILALLPNYLERSGSSLVYMVDYFITQSKYPQSGFFLHQLEDLAAVLESSNTQKTPTILIGVSFALLDLAEQFPMDLSNIIIMETGGMKGRRKEITREELHSILKDSFKVAAIHSEYGMTELLSQGYSQGNGIFKCSPTMRVLTREITDPLTLQQPGRNGAVQIIDLANLDSIAFIATEDVGVVYENGDFEIKGRLDISEIRGCNLMVE